MRKLFFAKAIDLSAVGSGLMVAMVGCIYLGGLYRYIFSQE